MYAGAPIDKAIARYYGELYNGRSNNSDFKFGMAIYWLVRYSD